MTTTPAFRHDPICEPGMWLQSLSDLFTRPWGSNWFVHAHCVVDDYGTLQPVAFSGMTVTNKLFGAAT